jgi:hypothetical protein
MDRVYGGQWQAITTQRWLDRLAADPDGVEVYVLDAQTRPSYVNGAAGRAGVGVVRIVLLDCAPTVRNSRLVDLRGQPELANASMDTWAVYLRGQADALGLPVIDTTSLPIEGVAEALVIEIESARAQRRTGAS